MLYENVRRSKRRTPPGTACAAAPCVPQSNFKEKYMKKGLAALMGVLLFLSLNIAVFAGGEKEAAGEKAVTIQYWSSGGGELQMNTIKEDMAKKLPNITIEVFGASHADFWKKMTVALASGTGPDVCHSKNFYMMEFAAKGALLHLDEFYKKDYLEMNPDVDSLFKERIETECRLKGKLYGLPIYSWWIAFMYNVDLFNEAGLRVLRKIGLNCVRSPAN